MKTKITYKKVYKAKTGFIKPDDVQEIGEFIERIAIRTPETILKEVKKHPEHKIYGYIFNNTDEKAIHEYRLDRVKWICREIIYKLEKTEAKVPVRLFYNVVSNGQNEYKTMDEVFNNKEYSNQVVLYALNELRGWTERYKIYSQLRKLCLVIEKNIPKIKVKRKK